LPAQLGLAPAAPAAPGRAVLEPLHWGGADILATPYGHCVAPDGTYQVRRAAPVRPAGRAPRCACPQELSPGGQAAMPKGRRLPPPPQVRPASEAQRRLAASHLQLDDYAPPGGPDFGASGRRPPPAGAARSQMDNILHQRWAGLLGPLLGPLLGLDLWLGGASKPPQRAAADGQLRLQARGARRARGGRRLAGGARQAAAAGVGRPAGAARAV
jgi:hypothetical protein